LISTSDGRYGTPVTNSQNAAVSMPAAPAQVSIPLPLA
jgi:hypothetical protein